MKFLTLVALIAVVSARVSLGSGDDCSDQQHVMETSCDEGLCCGTAAEDMGEDAEPDAEGLTYQVCYGAD